MTPFLLITIAVLIGALIYEHKQVGKWQRRCNGARGLFERWHKAYGEITDYKTIQWRVDRHYYREADANEREGGE